jgi:hypothetical protein
MTVLAISGVDVDDIEFAADLVHQVKDHAGFKIAEIDDESMGKILELLTVYQSSEAFISDISGKGILDDWFGDEDGQMMDIMFESQTGRKES